MTGYVIGETTEGIIGFLPVEDDEYLLKDVQTGRIFLCWGDEDAAMDEIERIIGGDA